MKHGVGMPCQSHYTIIIYCGAWIPGVLCHNFAIFIRWFSFCLLIFLSFVFARTMVRHHSDFFIIYCEPMQKGGFLIVKHILRRIIHYVLIWMFNNIHKKWVNLAHERMSVKHSVLGILHSWAISKECLILHWWHIPFATYQDSPSVIGESDIVYNNCDAVAPGQRDSGAAQRDYPCWPNR